MDRQKPQIAVLIPAYNAEGVIQRAISSLNANREPHDIIVIDDGSAKPVEKFLKPQPNLVILRLERNGGPSAARNMALDYIQSHGYAFVAQLDADDAAAPQRLEKQKAYLDSNPDIGIVGSFARVVSEKGETLYYMHLPETDKAIREAMFYNSCMMNPSLMFRASLLNNSVRYDEKYRSAQDYDFIRQLMRYGKIANIPEYLIDYTVSPTGITQSKTRQQMRARLSIELTHADWLSLYFYVGFFKSLAEYVVRFYILGEKAARTLQTNGDAVPVYTRTTFRNCVLKEMVPQDQNRASRGPVS